MKWLATIPRARTCFKGQHCLLNTLRRNRCYISTFRQVSSLPSWNLDKFKLHAFKPAIPVHLPRAARDEDLPPACSRWFIHKHDSDTGEVVSSINEEFWRSYVQIMVPLELTTTTRTTAASTNVEKANIDSGMQATVEFSHPQTATTTTFVRSEAPLALLLQHLTSPPQRRSPSPSPASSSPSMPSSTSPQSTSQTHHSLYLAQHPLLSLPGPLQQDLPTPPLVLYAGKGDIYDSSLWLGRPPTYTPLHRDPNPNLFFQLAGQKVIRLFPPDIGLAVFEMARERIAARAYHQQQSQRGRPSQGKIHAGDHSRIDGSSGGGGSSAISASFRGEEMMAGPEREEFHTAVWSSSPNTNDDITNEYADTFWNYGLEARLSMGEALFIPKGWWHSVKSVGDPGGVSGSVNWWFR